MTPDERKALHEAEARAAMLREALELADKSCYFREHHKDSKQPVFKISQALAASSTEWLEAKLAEARRQGAEQMRERIAKYQGRHALANDIRALPLEGE